MLLASVVFLLPVKTVYAQSVVTVDPAFQEVVISPDDDEVEAVISYTNDSPDSIELELFAYDFTQTDVVGSVGLLPPDTSYPHTLASFLKFEQNKLVLNPGEKQLLRLRVQNRISLTPGGHYAAVVSRLVQTQAERAEQRVVPAVSALILVRKTGGEQYHLSLSDVSWKPTAMVTTIPQKLDLMFRNDGNVHDIPRGTIRLIGIGKRTIFEGIINQSSHYVLPGTQRRISVQLEPRRWQLPVDVVRLETNGYAQFSEIPFASDESFILISWQFIVGATGLLLGGVSWWLWRRKTA